MPTTWKFAEYSPSTGDLLHVAEFSWPGESPESKEDFVARVEKNGNGVVFLDPEDNLPNALTHKYQVEKRTFVEREVPGIVEVGAEPEPVIDGLPGKTDPVEVKEHVHE